ncbi:MAG: molybdenum cofactor biosynthesis protein B [Hyphomicrobiales bacterium]|nr:molybdenum cofactor biosynthesis protein B [Hyphomicrobiales bacterium]
MANIDESRPFIPIRIAVLTISDTRSEQDDKSGATLLRLTEEAGHTVAARMIVKDEVADIQDRIKRWALQGDIDAIVTTGGTGLTGRDVTPEAVRPLFDKEIDGFPVLMHMISFQKIGTSTVQSRSLAGVIGACYVFCLPGSPGACKDAWDGILKAQFDIRHRPCNFVEIMPRLSEGRAK